MIIHVDASSPTPLPPFATPATASHTIQPALDLAVPGDVVQVQGTGPGGVRQVYTENLVMLRKRVHLVGVGGPVLDGGQAGSCVMVTTESEDPCAISGFEIRNGSAAFGGGVLVARCNAVVFENCIRGNAATDSGGGVCVVVPAGFSSGSSISNNVFEHNVPGQPTPEVRLR